MLFDFFARAAQHPSRKLIYKAEIMGGHHHSRTALGYFVKPAYDLLSGGRVEISGRFIGKNQFRAVKQRPRYDNTLLLATAQLVGHLIALIGHAHFFQHFVDAFLAIFRILPPCGPEHEIKIGKHVALHQ